MHCIIQRYLLNDTAHQDKTIPPYLLSYKVKEGGSHQLRTNLEGCIVGILIVEHFHNRSIGVGS